ncbi:MAG: DnaJ domain-containing protein [Chloroflexota bacterium]
MTISSNHYTLLDVKMGADLDTIKQAYRRKIRANHPDKFTADLAHAKARGNATDIRKLERKLAYAKKKTQELNAAYAVLSDADARRAYDEKLSLERQAKYDREQLARRMQRYDDAPASTASYQPRQPKHPNVARNESSIPWMVLAGFLLVMVVVFASFTNAITRNHTPFTTYVPSNPTAEGSVRMADLQATTSAGVATARARETLVLLPTFTPRGSSEDEALGDRLMAASIYDSAVTAYTAAIEEDPHNPVLYFKRAQAHLARYENGSDSAYTDALADYTEAITLDDMYTAAYLARGMLYYQAWQTDNANADDVRADLETYLSLADTVNEDSILAILDELP